MSNDNVNVLPFIKRKAIKDMTTEELVVEAERLEALVDVYSNTDWDSMQRVVGELQALDLLLLDRYNAENEKWLANHN
jgi:hypothetical protein